MRTREKLEAQLEFLKDRLHKLLEQNGGEVTEEVIIISQLLDKVIIEEMRTYRYDKK